ncbi:centrosomal protein of 57 kDa-like isoform X2 [Aplysia californica]|uniref:Centrosomal protein of 57 kDa-like isoform X2 n=1 Tax=Aplysia californica TaxID=6500 RepID=A0ABM0JMH1_APLCA|nr:centrosomal protein of 57 kDa-like isoform X2 [Aplysia californica]
MYPYSTKYSSKGSNRVPAYHSYGSSSTHLKQAASHSRPRPRHAQMEEDAASSAAGPAPTSMSTATGVSSKYMEYPPTKPFVNTDFTRPDRPVNAYPTSDRDAVISALRNLQDKVKKLEIERTAAEHNLRCLAEETEQYKGLVSSDRKATHTDTSSSGGAGGPVTNGGGGGGYVGSQTRELEGQLSSAEGRCQVLEQQLDYMRKLVENSEQDRRSLMEKTLQARQDRDAAGSDIKVHLDRLKELERDQLRLTATQTLAESKIKQLENQVREEKLHRRTLQDRTAQLETATRDKKMAPVRTEISTQAPSSTIKSPAPVSAAVRTKKPPKKKKKKAAAPPVKRPTSACRSSEPSRHYRLNLAEIPFVAGKSTTPSHSLGANVQKVLAMMKSHNTALCTNSCHHGSSEGQRSDSPASSTGSSVVSTDQELNDLLSQLQDEFGQLSSEHQDLMHQIHSCRDSRLQEQLEQELDVLVSRMEAKGQQIAKVRQHQQKLDEGKKVRPASATAKVGDKAKRPHSAGGRMVSTHYNHHQHRSQNGHSRPKPHNCNKPVGNSALGKPALFMLRDMKKLQTTLRRDDLCWE